MGTYNIFSAGTRDVIVNSLFLFLLGEEPEGSSSQVEEEEERPLERV